ncbi:hypothetical protein SAMN05444161_3666 [Rhizobiales bacterium GAS191]|nr:hypothetical protein SAMN05519103_02815 [Rhizobiales bacterium GAS113]SED64993.1 hypothetical protein SAMN05444161_3666 [Rhizobiales bacterium GAS191]
MPGSIAKGHPTTGPDTDVMKLYRYLTGPDDSSFCHRVTEALNRGWQLHGSPTLTYNPETKRVICGQAIVKEVEGAPYSPDLDLSRQ